MSAKALAILLRAISLVETGGNPQALGRHGERGEFAMTPAVVAECGGFGAKEAEKHARWIERQLEAGRIDPQPFNIALAWNAGVNAVLRGHAPMSSYDYALRVKHTYELILAETSPRAVAAGNGAEIRLTLSVRK